MMFATIALLLLAFSALSAGVENDGILVLDDKNFNQTVAAHEFLFVMFYSPHCKYCKEYHPVFVQVSQILRKQNSPIVFAKVDVIKYNQIKRENGILRYPTIILFRNGVPKTYRSMRTVEHTLRWLKAELALPAPCPGQKLTVEIQNAFVQKINKHRSNLAAKAGTSDMYEVKWDCKLSRDAMEKFEHCNDVVPVRKNDFFISQENRTKVIARVPELQYAEDLFTTANSLLQIFSIKNLALPFQKGSIRILNQLYWGDVTKMGCAVAPCLEGLYVGCLFNKGPIAGQRPFGTPTKCTSAKSCCAYPGSKYDHNRHLCVAS